MPYRGVAKKSARNRGDVGHENVLTGGERSAKRVMLIRAENEWRDVGRD